MSKRIQVGAILLALFVFGSSYADPPADKKPLDLPTGGDAKDSDDQAVAETIRFYGSDFNANGFFFCIDRSGSMAGLTLATLKAEVCAALDQLSKEAEFGLCSFSTDLSCFEEKPVRATPENVERAKKWVNALEAGGWSCLPDALVRTIELAHQSAKRERTIIVAGDGSPRCGSADHVLEKESLEDAAIANYKKIRINTVYVGSDSAKENGSKFFAALAAAHRGKFIGAE